MSPKRLATPLNKGSPTLKERRGSNHKLILVNPDEPRAGDFSYQLYDKLHPIHGNREEIARVKKEFAGLRGERVRLILNGQYIDKDTLEVRRFRLTRTFNYRKFWDAFGPGSAYARAMHAYRNKHSGDGSGDEYTTLSIALEVVDIDEEESDGEDIEE